MSEIIELGTASEEIRDEVLVGQEPDGAIDEMGRPLFYAD